MNLQIESHEVDCRPELFPGYVEELARHRQRERALRVAWAVPLPGPLGEAFGPARTHTTSGPLRPVTLGDLAMLQELKSPLVSVLIAKMAGEESLPQPKAVVLNDFELAEALWLWTRPHREAREWLDKSRPAFWKQAMMAFLKIPRDRRPLLAEKVVRHLFRGFGTTVALRASSGDRSERIMQYGMSGDGFGWWLCLLGTMMRDFGMPRDYALGELPLAQAFALQAWGQYNSGAGLELDSDGYVAQEAARPVPPAGKKNIP